MTDTPAANEIDRKRLARWHWIITIVYVLVLAVSVPVALVALIQSPVDGVGATLFFFMNLSIAAVPFTIGLSLAAAWMYHRNGAFRAAFIPHLFPLVNLVLILVLRFSLQIG